MKGSPNGTLAATRSEIEHADREQHPHKGATIWPAIDFFSGGGGMSSGFARRKPFRVIAAIDAEEAKPCERAGILDCNGTYGANIGIKPFARDVGRLDPPSFLVEIADRVEPPLRRGDLTVLLCCPPCTDFSRAKPSNHLVDSSKNSLVVKCADLVDALYPEFVVMENARELIRGSNAHHYREFKNRLERMGYEVRGAVHMLTKYGLPQVRERAIVIASRIGRAETLDDLWDGWEVDTTATTVRHAIGSLASRPVEAGMKNDEDPMHQAPGFASELVWRRMDAIPHDGGSWYDLADHPEADELLIDSMKDRLARRDLGSHCDVYGRMAWDRPAPTIKRECAHVGNGRYAHPEQTRLLTVREMAFLQGFPGDYIFTAKSLANRYRHIGDAVPPMIAYQFSALILWMKTGRRPEPEEWILPGTSLSVSDLRRKTPAVVTVPMFR